MTEPKIIDLSDKQDFEEFEDLHRQSLRDEYAGRAMQAMLCEPDPTVARVMIPALAFDMAEAMLEEREKRNG